MRRVAWREPWRQWPITRVGPHPTQVGPHPTSGSLHVSLLHKALRRLHLRIVGHHWHLMRRMRLRSRELWRLWHRSRLQMVHCSRLRSWRVVALTVLPVRERAARYLTVLLCGSVHRRRVRSLHCHWHSMVHVQRLPLHWLM